MTESPLGTGMSHCGIAIFAIHVVTSPIQMEREGTDDEVGLPLEEVLLSWNMAIGIGIESL